MTSEEDELDRHRRRVLWALPTGLYLVGSRAGDEVNLMTANLVVQVCMEPKLVGVALERDSVTARLVGQGRSFTISLLHRADRDVVRRFVKPVTDVERDPEGTSSPCPGTRSRRSGRAGSLSWPPPLATWPARLSQADELGSHTLVIGEVTEIGGEPGDADILRMEDTRMHYGG